MKILVISPGNLPVPPKKGGSVETVIDQIFSRLAENEQITIIGGTNPRQYKEKQSKDKANYKIIRIPYLKPSTYIEKGMKEVATENFDLIQIENRPIYVHQVRKAFPNTPIILSLHSLTFMDKLTTDQANEILSMVNGVITVSNFVTNTMQKRYPTFADLFYTNHLGVDNTKFQPLSKEKKDDLRRRWNFPVKSGHPNILFVGRIVPGKGLHTLIRAVSLIKKKYPGIRIIVVGASWPGKKKETQYIRHVRLLSRRLAVPTYFTGYIAPKNIHALYHLGDIFVCPTQFQEGLPLVNLEAMASGVPVITSNQGGISEVIEHGKTGLLVTDFKNPKAFAKELNRLLKNPKFIKSMTEEARGYVVNYFNWEKSVASIKKYYLSIIQK